ncbi:MAG TPA: hypothetical protein VK633_03315, partial [Verrucomicrobiae bacterium]|nr:hypothetical protein [Verrucomicrobiae bacterium]
MSLGSPDKIAVSFRLFHGLWLSGLVLSATVLATIASEEGHKPAEHPVAVAKPEAATKPEGATN